MKRAFQVVLVLMLLGVGTAAAQDPAPYLALGDSIPFGFNPLIYNPYSLAPPPPHLLLYYHGYPQFVANELKLDLTNPACPAQTSGSFLGPTFPPPDNGCNQWRAAGLPLFVSYSNPLQTQIEYAVSFLAANPKTKLVTITIGGDDLLYLEEVTCAGSESCESLDLPLVLNTYANNLRAIYAAILSTGYRGPIVAVNYFSPDYRNAFETEAVSALNQVTSEVTEGLPNRQGKVADTFLAFRLASVLGQGLPCALGLAFPNTSGPGCDVHPTALGQLAIANLVVAALK